MITHGVRRMSLSQRSRLLLAGLLCLSLSACVVAPVATVQPAAPVLLSLPVCTSSLDATQLALPFAEATGLDRDYGLDLESTAVSNGPTAATALLAGDFDICQIAGPAVVSAVAAGGDLVIVAGLFNRQPYYLVTRQDVDSPADLVGQAIGIGGPGTATDAAARAALAHFGLRPEEDVALLGIGGPSARLAALLSDQIAGTILAPPEAMLAMAEGAKLLLDFAELDAAYQHIAIVTTRHFLAEHPDIVAAYVQTAAAAVAQMQNDKDLTLKVMAEYLGLDSLTHAKAMELTYDLLIRDQMKVDLTPSLAGVQAIVQDLQKDNAQIAVLTPEDVVDLTIVTELVNSGFFESLSR